MRFPARFSALVLAWLLADTAAGAGELQVTVAGVRNDSGKIRVSLYRAAADFPTKDGRFMEIVMPARAGNLTGTFLDVPAGTYGLAAFQDENDNVAFDETFLGIPKEGFGNDAPVFFGPPEFEAASVTVDRHPGKVILTLRYWGPGR